MKKQAFQKMWRWSKWIFASLFILCMIISLMVYLMRDKIVDKVVTELNKNFTTPIKVSSIDLTFWASFPNLSVDFNDIYVKDAVQSAKETDTLFYSERLRLKFNPFDIIKKEYKVKKIEVSPGYAHIKNFEDGQNNYTIFKSKGDTSSAEFQFNLNEVAFEDFRMDYSNYGAKQFHSTTLNEMILSGDFNEKIIDLNAESQFDVNFARSGEVTLFQNQSAYFDLNIKINQETGAVSLAEAPVEIAHLPFTFALTVEEDLIDVHLKAKNLQLVDVAKSINHSGTDKVKDFSGVGMVQFDLHYTDQRKENEEGKLACSFGVKNGSLIEPSKNLRISGINVSGFYGNSDQQKGEHLNLSELKFRTAAGPFQGNLLLTHFEQPRYQGKANGQIDLAVLHSIFPIPQVHSTSGQVKVDSRFDIQTRENQIDLNGCKGELNLRNVHCQLKDDKRYFDHITGDLSLSSNNLDLSSISLTVGRSDLALNGKLDNLQNYINKKGSLETNLNIRSAFLDVQDFSTSDKADEINNGRNYILPNDIHGNVHLLANNLKYENHQFKHLGTELKLNGRSLHFTRLSLQNAGTDIIGSALIEENSPEIFTISTNASSDNISFQPLFKEWDNFHQTVISSENISGFAHANLKFKAPFDLRSGIDMNKIIATIDVKIDNGRLKNVDAFRNITASLQESKTTKLILKQNNITTFEKNLLDLKFESLNNTLSIHDGKLTIPKMVISSNALTVNLGGTHTFSNMVDYHFDFNLRDIKKIKTETEFGDVIDDGTGLRLFCHMFGPLDDPTIKWDQEQKKLLTKENFENEKLTAKQMLKAEFGLFKKDTAVIAYKAKEQPKETIVVNFGPAKKEDPPTIDSPKKEGKLGKTFNKWKEEAGKEKSNEIIYDPRK